jgi:hypothetical protein
VSYFRLRLAIVVGALLALAVDKRFCGKRRCRHQPVYGAGGNTGASLTTDFVELETTAHDTRRPDGMSVRTRVPPARGTLGSTTTQLTELWERSSPASTSSSTSPWHGRRNLAGGADIVDATPIGAWPQGPQGRAGDRTTRSTAIPPRRTAAGTLGRIVDLVGYGNATFFEGTAAAPTINATTSAARAGSGCTETDDNAADFATLSPPAPRNSATPAVVCGGTPTPTNPTAVSAATPASVLAGGSSLLTVTVTPGTNPTSTDLSVMGDLSQIGGSDTQAFFDDGTNGDAVAGNNVFSFGATVDAATTPGTKSLPAVVTDGQERTAGAAIALTVAEPPAAPIEISEIQGAAHLSPHSGDQVTTTGIVIGKIGSSFYIQGSDAGRQSGHLGRAPGLERPPQPASASATRSASSAG